MKRTELIGGFINSIFLLSTAVFMTFEAIPKFFFPQDIDMGLAIWIVAAVGLLINLVSTILFGITGHGHSHGSGHGHSHGGGGHGHSHGASGHGHSHGKSKV